MYDNITIKKMKKMQCYVIDVKKLTVRWALSPSKPCGKNMDLNVSMSEISITLMPPKCIKYLS